MEQLRSKYRILLEVYLLFCIVELELKLALNNTKIIDITVLTRRLYDVADFLQLPASNSHIPSGR